MGTNLKARVKTGPILQKNDVVLLQMDYVAIDQRRSSIRNRI